MKKIKNIIIANGAEAFREILSNVNDSDCRVSKINNEHYLSNRSLFWGEGNKLIITPFPVQEVLLKKANEVLGLVNVENLYPLKTDISLSSAIIQDKKLFNKLKNVIKENPQVTLSSYAHTPEFAFLVGELKKEGLHFNLDQNPLENCDWLVTYLGSKIGFRSEILKLQKNYKSILTPQFFICRSKEEVEKISSWFCENKTSCVVKVPSGEGGWGIIIVDCNEYFTKIERERIIRSKMNEDSIWDNGPYLVEEFIQSNSKNNLNSPSIEFFIDNQGATATYACNQIVDKAGRFIGVTLGKDCIEVKTKRVLHRVGKVIASRYYELGYRGFFDIDFIMSSEGKAYPIETNIRRTGGTHVFDLTQKIFGRNWINKAAVLSSDTFRYGDRVLPVEKILEKVSSISFPIDGEKKGVVITISSIDQPVFGFIIFATNLSEVMRIYNKLTCIWNKDIVK